MSTKPEISVIICAHNPRLDYFKRVLQSLKTQTLEQTVWELLIIDNASHCPIETITDLSWHPAAKIIQEPTLGLTPARLRGICESVGETIVFVDDDNVLDQGYLEQVMTISGQWRILGAWGGQIRPEFEEQPPEWTKPYWRYLAIHEFARDKWSNLAHQYETTPCGAGLCIRRSVAERYLEMVVLDPKRAKLGRTGRSLTSCEDIDIAFIACTIGLGTGRFISLKLTHLIPKQRLQEEYLLRLVKGIAYSSTVLSALWGKLPAYTSRSQRLLQFYSRWRMDARSRRFYQASQAGKQLALEEIATWS